MLRKLALLAMAAFPAFAQQGLVNSGVPAVYRYIGPASAWLAQPCNPSNGELAYATDAINGGNIYVCVLPLSAQGNSGIWKQLPGNSDHLTVVQAAGSKSSITGPGPISWATVDGTKPWFQLGINVGNLPYSITPGGGNNQPFAVLGVLLDAPNTNIGGAGLNGITIVNRSNSPYTNGAASLGLRISTYTGADHGFIEPISTIISDTNRDAKSAGAISHPTDFMLHEFDFLVTNSGSGGGLGYLSNITSYITSTTTGVGPLAHFLAAWDAEGRGPGSGLNAFPNSFNATPVIPTVSYWSGTGAATYALIGEPQLFNPAAGGFNAADSQIINLNARASGGSTIAYTEKITSSGVATYNIPTAGTYSFGINGVPQVAISAAGGLRPLVLGTVAGANLTISSNTLTPTGNLHHVGAGLIKTITPPAGFTGGGLLYLIPDAAFTYDATGNVVIPTGGAATAVVNKLMVLSWDGTQWTPSY